MNRPTTSTTSGNNASDEEENPPSPSRQPEAAPSSNNPTTSLPSTPNSGRSMSSLSSALAIPSTASWMQSYGDGSFGNETSARTTSPKSKPAVTAAMA